MTFYFEDFVKTYKDFGVHTGVDISLDRLQYTVRVFPESAFVEHALYTEKNNKKKFEKIANELATQVLAQINKHLEK